MQIDYSSFNKPTRISRGDEFINFRYGPDRARYFKETDDGEKTYYIGGIFEVVENADSSFEKLFVGDFLQVSRKPVNSQSNNQESYLHRDHLGSITLTTREIGIAPTASPIVEPTLKKIYRVKANDSEPTLPENNTVAAAHPWYEPVISIARYSPFGRKFEASDPGYFQNRGYTGHEHLDLEEFIHMNGRVYDPVVGRFLSPDPIIQDPYNSQNYNRYSYVLNNPLSATDPTGYLVESSLIDLVMANASNYDYNAHNAGSGWSIDGLEFNYTYAQETRSIDLLSPSHDFLMDVRSNNADFFNNNPLADSTLGGLYVTAALILPASSAEGALAAMPPLKNAGKAYKNVSEAIGSSSLFNSFGELRRNTNLPLLNQGNAPTCGPTSCGMVLDTLLPGRNVTELAGLTGASNRVVRIDELARTLSANGLDATFNRRLTIDALSRATSGQNPAIVAIRTPQGGHAVVVDGITRRQGQDVVAIRDPHGRAYFQTLDAFKEVFLGQGVTIK
ncbi:hypothetical protein OLMES_3311 [Oleiphilus messinensis]|uniref:Peptidase C39-like domain-containing protein n=1 Tax=Oleiphilus messinensis TaxID=141451 RepID=A0A1Y0IA63_9GAMM|nr:RHS repeat-associated core domain-containing protein [Oleiphilus messinensis]ARU57351.1 hypothetical protein OLMES_3311 [Oleiphilus messinensis]